MPAVIFKPLQLAVYAQLVRLMLPQVFHAQVLKSAQKDLQFRMDIPLAPAIQKNALVPLPVMQIPL